MVETLLSMTILLQLGLRPTQLLFYAAQERTTAQNHPATNGNLSRDRGAPVSTRKIQDRSHPAEELEVAEGQVSSYAASFGMTHQVGLG